MPTKETEAAEQPDVLPEIEDAVVSDVDVDGPDAERGLDDDGNDEESRSSRLYRFTRRLLDRRELGEDAKLLVGTVLETSDRAKSEAVKMVAREVRHYLDELQWKEDLRDLMTGHTLKVSAEFTLIPKEDAPAPTSDEDDVQGGPEGEPEPTP